jgi:hypothetical protein
MRGRSVGLVAAFATVLGLLPVASADAVATKRATGPHGQPQTCTIQAVPPHRGGATTIGTVELYCEGDIEPVMLGVCVQSFPGDVGFGHVFRDRDCRIEKVTPKPPTSISPPFVAPHWFGQNTVSKSAEAGCIPITSASQGSQTDSTLPGEDDPSELWATFGWFYSEHMTAATTEYAFAAVGVPC